MIRRKLLGIVIGLAAVLAGCGTGPSFVLVTLHSDTDLQAASLKVTVTNAGQSTAATITPTGHSISFPPDQSFSFQFGAERRGDVVVDVIAMGATGQLAHAVGRVSLVTHGRADLTISFTAGPAADMGVSLDMAPDSSVIADMTTPDLRAAVFSLAAPAHVPLDYGPYVLVAGDFNRDGKLDLAAGGNTAQNAGMLSVLLGNGDGTFKQPTNYSVDSAWVAVMSADLDQDGNPDIIVASIGSVGVMRGDGRGTFAPVIKYPTTGPLGAAAIGDVNGDQILDVVAAVSGNMTGPCGVDVMLGAGSGALSPPIPTAFGSNLACNAIALGDVDGDGLIDSAVEYYSGVNGAWVLLGRGNGHFTSGIHVDVPNQPLQNEKSGSSLLLKDVDHDRKLDVLLAEAEGAANGNVGLLSGMGSGTFAAPVLIPANNGTKEIVSGDLNNDGFLDIVATDPQDGALSVLLGNGDGTFAAGPRYPAGKRPTSPVIGDFDGNGLADVVTADHSSPAQQLSVFLNDSH